VRKPPLPEREFPRLIRPSDAAGVDEPAILSPLNAHGAARFRRGLLVHAMLARLPQIAAKDRHDIALAFLTARGVAGDEAQALANETLAVIDHPDFRAAFASNSRAEIAIVADLPEFGRVNGRIDRLAVTDDEVLAIDFKTNRPPPARAQDVSAIYLAQMALYRAALARIFPDRRIACALVWTEGPSLMELPTALLDAEIARIRMRLDSGPARS
jgi:ATP-dependent helicase/nuclease subunit A